ncbi:MAG: HIRAN domain-containing protein [Bacillota bacterium]|nr:HIRAN domain-containing protein [Bacillota bacterium]
MALFKKKSKENGFLKAYNEVYNSIQSKNSDRTLKKETYTVVGIDYYISNINKLRVSNPDYRKRTNLPLLKRIYRYSYINKPVKLVPEPKNPHDKNAIQVLIAGELVGYISREDNLQVGRIIKRSEIKYISSFIQGGEYKVVSANGDAVKSEDGLSINISIGYV